MRDAAIIGGGILGCTVALHLARGGMSTTLIEREPNLCTMATAVNTGNISIMWTRPYLAPYALAAVDLWKTTPQWLGMDCGFRARGGLKLAFTPSEAARLETAAAAFRALGAPVEMVTANRAREIEPALTADVAAASFCALDGYANAPITAKAFAPALTEAGVDLRLGSRIAGVDGGDGGFSIVFSNGAPLRTRRLVIAGGVWIEQILRLIGVDLPVICRVSQVTVTERMPPTFRTVLGAASGVLSLKQSDDGTVLIGGGWQGFGDPDRGPVQHDPDNLLNNLRLAVHAIPALRDARVVRSWLGLEARVADMRPLCGAVPGVADAWTLGAIDTGYTIGPFMGRLLAQAVLGQEPEMPLFDPARLMPAAPSPAAAT